MGNGRPDDDETELDTGPTALHEAAPQRSVPARYELGGVLGAGGMGEVVACNDGELGRPVALKRLRADKRRSDALIARFLREARIQARLDHPAIVPVHELRADGDEPYFTMKRVQGVTLARILSRQATGDADFLEAYGFHRLLTAFGRVCEAVAYAHDNGVIHRDLKPANIMIADFGAVYVIDWGIAKVEGESTGSQWIPSTPTPASTDLTLEGEQLGTLAYMAPELTAEGAREADERTDVYSLGVILTELLMRQRLAPLLEAGRSVEDALRLHAADRPPELVSVCVRATAARAERYSSVRELLRDVEAYQRGDRDVLLRRELSLRHTDEATRAFASTEGSEHERMRQAMSSVGRALALDPDNADAMRMLVSLLSYVPSEVPAAVDEAVKAKGRENTVRAGRLAALLYAGVWGFTPLTLTMGILDWGLFLAVLAVSTLAMITTFVAWRNQHTWKNPALFPGFLSSTLLIALLSTVFGPFVLVPTFLAVNTMGHAFTWYHGKSWQGFLVAAPALVVPYLLEHAGVFPDMTRFEDGVMKVFPWAVDIAQPLAEALLLTSSLALLAGGLYVAVQMRQNLERALRRSQLHTWQLEQMLPRAALEPAHLAATDPST